MWIGKFPIYIGDIQIAEITTDKEEYHIRNLRPNGTIGICYSSKEISRITEWLDIEYPGWTKIKKIKLEELFKRP